ncbi:Type IV secretion system protein virB6 [Rickettsiales bacterium Ac37b]|nr:Type IV secretion system protein virB6 [Rickettsiales bacterium Ac37b]
MKVINRFIIVYLKKWTVIQKSILVLTGIVSEVGMVTLSFVPYLAFSRFRILTPSVILNFPNSNDCLLPIIRNMSIIALFFTLSACDMFDIGTCFFSDVSVSNDGKQATMTTKTEVTVRADGNYSSYTIGCGHISCNIDTNPRCQVEDNPTGTKTCSIVPSAENYDPNCKPGSDGVTGTMTCNAGDPGCVVEKSKTGTVTCTSTRGQADYVYGCPDEPGCTRIVQDNNETNSGQWLNSGLWMESGQTLNVKTSGNVYICGTHGVSENNGLGKDFAINSRSYQWTDTGINIQKGDLFAIVVGEPRKQVNDQFVDICNSCTNTNCPPSCNRWATWNGGSSGKAPDAWKPQTINSNKICSSGGCTSGGQAEWNIRGIGLYGVIGARSNPTDSSGTFPLQSSSYNSEDQLITSFEFVAGTKNSCDSNSDLISTQGEGNLQFRIWDCDDANNCYGDNMGGYTVYVTHYGCPGINGCPNVKYAPSGGLQMLVTTKDPNKECILDSQHTTKGDCGQFLSNANGGNPVNKTGNVWVRVQDTTYSDNIGSYKVELSYETVMDGTGCDISSGYFSAIVCYIMNIVKSTLFDSNTGAIPVIFNKMTCSNTTDKSTCYDYLTSIRALLTLFVMIYAISFMFGLVQISQLDLVLRVMKMGLVLALTSPNSWQFFYSNFFDIFIDGSAQLVNMMNGNDGSVANPFTFADHVLAVMLFSKTAVFRLIALLFSSKFGIIYLVMILYGVFIYIGAMFKAVIVYMMAYVATGLLISLAPIFIPCILFSMTRHVFDNWLKYLGKYALEPVILLTGLGILTQILLTTIGMFGFAACWKCVIPFNLGVPIPGVPSIPLFCLNFFGIWGMDNIGGGHGILSSIMGLFPQIIFFIIIVKLIDEYGSFSQKIATILTNSLSAPAMGGPGGAAGQMAEALTEAPKHLIGMDKGSIGRRKERNRIQEMAREELARESKKEESDRDRPKENNTNDKVQQPKSKDDDSGVSGIV